ncbi:MAG: sugar phosphate isomerase/epimerase [Acidobacteria bacterium]|nr:sugar phosphate isomerase/epimerase [Acidobacteriota bacterium]
MKQTRRELMLSVGCALAAPAMMKARSAPRRYPIGFSTLGCPKWDWKTILENAAKWGYAAIELRGLQGEMDLTKRPEFSAAGVKQSLRDLQALGLQVSDLGASTRLHEPDAAVRQKQLDEGKRFIDLARRLKSPYVRVFGDRWVQGEPHEKTIERIVDGLRELARHARGTGVAVIVETHGDFTESATVARMVKMVESREVGVLWDTHHTWVAGKEQPADSLRALSPYVRHVHIKDSVPQGQDVRYVLPGQGKLPLREIVRVLAQNRYRGFYGLEWEKAWHPEIEEPEVAFPHFAKLMGGYLKEAGVAAK